MSIILNKEELATNPLRKDALDILEAGYEAINTEKILRKKLDAHADQQLIKDSLANVK